MKFKDASKDLPDTLKKDTLVLRVGVYGGCALFLIPALIPGM